MTKWGGFKPFGKTPTAAITTGIVGGIDNIGSGVAIATLLFAGPLTAGLGLGVGIILLGGFALTLLVALRGTHPNSIAAIQETNIAILAGIIASMAATLDASTEVKIATAFAILGTSTVIAAILMWSTGFFGLGKMTRILPYPVIAGFLAGTGWLLVDGALVVLTGQTEISGYFDALSDQETLWRIAPAVALALSLYIFSKLFPYPATMGLTMIAAAPMFYAILYAKGINVAEAKALGQLPDIDYTSGILLPDPDLFLLVHWPSVLSVLPIIMAAATLSLIGFLLNLSGVELATGKDVDLDKELRATGIANIVSGGFGGPMGFVNFSASVLADKLGVRDRSAGIAMTLIMLIGFCFAGVLSARMPVFLTAGLLIYLGFNLLNTWCFHLRKTLPILDWAIVVLIVFSVMLLDFMSALGVGLLVSIAVFVYNYSKLPVIRKSIDGSQRSSTIERSASANKLLMDHRGTIEILQLQGYLFFGTAERLVTHMTERLNAIDHPPLKHFILDMQHVSGLDSAAVSCFIKIQKKATQQTVNIQITHASEHVLKALKLGGVIVDGETKLTKDIDHALEQIEEQLLDELEYKGSSASLKQHFSNAIGPHKNFTKFINSMERKTLSAEELLIKAGETTQDVFFIEKGRLEVRIHLEGGKELRVSTLTEGAIVGEIALYLKNERTADVVAATSCTLFKLSPALLAQLEAKQPELALLAHRLMASNLSQKITRANSLIQSQS